MAKKRVEIPSDIASEVLFASDFTCCVCESKDHPIQIHHIDEDPSNNDKQNLAVLCTPCHDKTMVQGGFGRKLDAASVVQYRDSWIKRVAARRDKADELAASRMARMTSNATPVEKGNFALRAVPIPNLIVTGVQKPVVQEVQDGIYTAGPTLHSVGWREAEWLKHNGPRALVLQFTNEPSKGSANAGCLATATLVFSRENREIRRLTGCWLELATDIAEFRVDASHGLIVGLISGNRVQTVAKRRVPADFGSQMVLTHVEPLAIGLRGCDVLVRITNADTGDFLTECSYVLDSNTMELIAR